MSHFRLARLRRYPRVWWTGVVLVAGTAGFVVTTSVTSAQSAAARLGDVTNVAVITHALPVGTVLSENDIRSESRPRAFLPQTSLVLDAVGRTVSTPVVEGDVVSELNVGTAGVSATASLVRPGERALAVSLKESHPTLAVGDHVDVIATFDHADAATDPAVVIARDARVVQLNETSAMVSAPADVAPKIALATTSGTVVLALSGT